MRADRSNKGRGRGGLRLVGVLWGAIALWGTIEPAQAQTCQSVVRFTTPLGALDVTLLDHDAPNTAANFLHYVDNGRFSNLFFHRLIGGFVLQGGGFTHTDAGGLGLVPPFAPILNEFQMAHGNVAGTIAVARYRIRTPARVSFSSIW